MIPSDAFPRLIAGTYQITSPASREYNCIAWAAGNAEAWWWPDSEGVGYWPADVPRQETVAAFVELYRSLGYEPVTDAAPESGYEKLVLYALEGRPTHAARQLASGKWSSKLGRKRTSSTS